VTFKGVSGKQLLIIFGLWLLIYIPSLGSLALRGQEGRRIFPAIEMVQSGELADWVVPQLWGKNYYNKPPAINWLVALSFIIIGEQTVFSARLTSAVLVLGFAVMISAMPSGWLSRRAKVLAAMIFITSAGIIEKGRMIEIEAAYTVFTGAAILFWMNTYSLNRSSWLIWPVSCCILAFGVLLKGPFILLFFYSIVIAVVMYERKPASFFCPAHIFGAILMAGIALGWFFLARSMVGSDEICSRMINQFSMRFFLNGSIVSRYAKQFLKSILYLVPWLFFVSALWDKNINRQIPPEFTGLYKGLRTGILFSFVAICFLPRGQSRYTLPYIAPASLLLGYALSHYGSFFSVRGTIKFIIAALFVIACITSAAGLLIETHDIPAVAAAVFAFAAAAVAIKNLAGINNIYRLSLAVSVLVVVFTLQYATFLTHSMNAREKSRSAAFELDKTLYAGRTLYIYIEHPRRLNYPFYLRHPVEYITRPEQITGDISYLAGKEKVIEKLRQELPLCQIPHNIVYDFIDEQGARQLILKLDDVPVCKKLCR